MSSAKNQSPDKWDFLVIPNGNDRTTNPAHKLFARQRHSVAANTGVAVSSLSSSFSVRLGTAP